MSSCHAFYREYSGQGGEGDSVGLLWGHEGMNTSHSGNERYMVTAVDEAALIVSVLASHVPRLPCASSLPTLSLFSTVPPPAL